MSAPILKVGDMVRHNDGTIGRVVEILEPLEPGTAHIVQWRTVASGHRTSTTSGLTVIDESKLRWRAEVVR